ncbi:hypothetical protein ACLOJK_037026 [Asimina triloba]
MNGFSKIALFFFCCGSLSFSLCCGLRRGFSPSSSHGTFNSMILISGQRRQQLHALIACAKKKDGNEKKKSWWQLFFGDDSNWFGLREDDLLEDPEGLNDEEMPDAERFEAWKSRAEAICELREAQEDAKNAESRQWEDWIVEGSSSAGNTFSDGDWADGLEELNSEGPIDPREIMPEKGIPGAIRDLIVGNYEDELLYEDRVFRYVKTVPLAAEILDVRRSQKLKMVKALEVEKARFRFEVEIGKSPPLSDEETWLELRHKA